MIANPHEMYLPGLESVSYPPKKINTVAVKVTPENIGALSIEFEAELMYEPETDEPYFFATFYRPGDSESRNSVEVEIRADDWLVVLWDQYRVFRDNEFKNTFRFNNAPAHELSVPQLDLRDAEKLQLREDDARTGFAVQHGFVPDEGQQ